LETKKVKYEKEERLTGKYRRDSDAGVFGNCGWGGEVGEAKSREPRMRLQGL